MALDVLSQDVLSGSLLTQTAQLHETENCWCLSVCIEDLTRVIIPYDKRPSVVKSDTYITVMVISLYERLCDKYLGYLLLWDEYQNTT